MMHFIGTVRILKPMVPGNATQWRLSRFIPRSLRRFANENDPCTPPGSA